MELLPRADMADTPMPGFASFADELAWQRRLVASSDDRLRRFGELAAPVSIVENERELNARRRARIAALEARIAAGGGS